MRNVKINGIYRHFKGDYYIVEDIATNADTGEKYVVYRALYGDNALWIRERTHFLSLVDKEKYPHVNQKYRFEETVVESIKNN